MKILFLGDSMTEGAAATAPQNTYPALVRKRTGFDVEVFGLGGTRLAPQKVPFQGHKEYDEDFLTRAKKMPKDADVVFVFGGTNDFGHGDAPLGKPGDKEGTFTAGVNHLYDYLKATYGENKIKIILPIHRYDEDSRHGEFFMAKKEDSPTLKEYIDLIREIAESYHFDVLDFNDVIGYVDPENKNANPFIYCDGIHPNDNGHNLIANLIVDYLHEHGYSHYNKNSTIWDMHKDKVMAPYSWYLFYNWGSDTFPNSLFDINRMTFLGINKFYEFIQKGIVKLHHFDPEHQDVNVIHIAHHDHRKVAIVAGGGGYRCVCTAMESLPIGLDLYDEGYDVFLLNYRVCEDANSGHPVQDLAHAVRYLLDHEKELDIDMKGYAAIGSSAAGYLMAQWGTNNHGYQTFGLPKPGILGLQYPVVTMQNYVHGETRLWALGTKHPTQEMCDEYSTEYHVDETYPATYMVHAFKDGCVDELNADNLAKELKKYHIPYQLAVYPGQGHGWGQGDGSMFDGWVTNFVTYWRKVTNENR